MKKIFTLGLINRLSFCGIKPFDRVDWTNVIEEIESLGRSEYRVLVSEIDQLVLHWLKWQYQAELRSHNVQYSIDKPRIEIERPLEDNTGLKSLIQDYSPCCPALESVFPHNLSLP